MSSPYPWYYGFRWLLDYFSPSTSNPTDLVPLPREGRLSDASTVLRVAFLGDLMCMQNDRIPDVDPVVRDALAGADLVFVNCEAPVMFEEVRPYARYVGHFAMAEDFLFGLLDRLGVPAERAVLSIANNHIADQGEDGLRSSVERIERRGAVAVGALLDADDPPYRIVERSGRRVGVIAWSHWLNSEQRLSGTPNIVRTPAVEAYDWSTVRAEVDHLVATPHWEYEFRHFPRQSTRDLARRLTSAGVDVIAGHHPHVLMPLERFGDRLCAYSLGNLNGPALERVGWPVRLGGVLVVELGEAAPVAWRLVPFAQRRGADLAADLVAVDAVEGMRERLEVVFPGAKRAP